MAINIDSTKKYMDNNSSSTHRKCNNSGYKQLKLNATVKRQHWKERVREWQTFIDYSIVQSKHGISIDQSNHIYQTILKTYFKDVIDKNE